jgi:hypothetical protein
VLLFVRGFGDLLLLSSVALAPSLVRSPVQLWRRRGALRPPVAAVVCYCRCLLAAGFEAQVFGHLAHVRLPLAFDAGAFRRVLAACWPRVECLASPSLLPLMSQLQRV